MWSCLLGMVTNCLHKIHIVVITFVLCVKKNVVKPFSLRQHYELNTRFACIAKWNRVAANTRRRNRKNWLYFVSKIQNTSVVHLWMWMLWERWRWHSECWQWEILDIKWQFNVCFRAVECVQSCFCFRLYRATNEWNERHQVAVTSKKNEGNREIVEISQMNRISVERMFLFRNTMNMNEEVDTHMVIFVCFGN